MEEKTNLETTSFVSRSYGGARRTSLPGVTRSTGKRKRRDRFGSAYLIARLGICTLLFCGALALKLKGDEQTLAVIGKMAYETNTEETEEERLGRLKFVDLPSIIDVFAPAREAILPVSFKSFSSEEEGRSLVLKANAGESVVSPVSGSVSAVGEDDELGAFVTVSTDDDVEFTLYGLGEICVERGQPVKQDQRVGVTEGERLTVRSYRAGRPVELTEIFGLGSEG